MNERFSEEQEAKDEKKGKKFDKSLLFISVTSLIIACSVFINNKINNNSYDTDLLTVIDNNRDNTLFDEILVLDEVACLYKVDSDEMDYLQFEDAINLLENNLRLEEKISNLDIEFNDLNQLSDSAKRSTLDFYNENGIDSLIDLYNDSNNTKIDKARIAQQLLYIQDNNRDWLQINGLDLSKSILYKLISGGVIDSYGTFTPSEYNSCVLPKRSSLINQVKLVDEVSGEEDIMSVVPLFNGGYGDAIALYQDILSIQDTYNKNKLNIEDMCEIVSKTLDTSKRCVESNLDNNNGFIYSI